MLRRASKLADRCESGSFAGHVEIVAALVRRITVAQDKVAIEIDRNGLLERLLDRAADHTSKREGRRPILIDVSVRFQRRGVEAKLVVLDEKHAASEPDANLVRVLARAHEWFRQIVRGEVDGIGAIARAERLDRSYVIRVICLAFLAPETTKTILEGRHPPELTAKRLISSALKIPLIWTDQRGFLADRLEQ